MRYFAALQCRIYAPKVVLGLRLRDVNHCDADPRRQTCGQAFVAGATLKIRWMSLAFTLDPPARAGLMQGRDNTHGSDRQ